MTVLRIPGTENENQFIVGERGGETYLSRKYDKSIWFKRGNSMTDMIIKGQQDHDWKGYVGIGTNDPKSLLHVSGNVLVKKTDGDSDLEVRSKNNHKSQIKMY